LRLEVIEMLGPGDAPVRQYGFTYDLGPTTKRTRLTEVKECGSDKVCKPPTRFQYSPGEAGFTKIKTGIPAPTSKCASPMVADGNGDGRGDLIRLVLLTQKDGTWKRHDTKIERPFPLGASPPPPVLTSKGASVHLADLDGDGVPDLIQCQDHSRTHLPDPFLSEWMVHLWRPARGGTAAGFDLAGQRDEALTGIACNAELHTLDVDADGKVYLLLPEMTTHGGTEKVADATYRAWSGRADGTFEGFDTKLPVVAPGFPIAFLDVNGDGLPDAVMPAERGVDGQHPVGETAPRHGMRSVA
jgi:hypothetical protein